MTNWAAEALSAVRQAADDYQRLVEETAELRTRVQELETELAEVHGE